MKPRCIKVNHDEQGCILVEWLAQRLELSRRRAKQLLDGRRVFVNKRRVWMARHPLSAGDEVEIVDGPTAATAQRIALIVLYDQDHMVIVDKPANLLANQNPASAEVLLRRQLQRPALHAIHRLDRDTTGCLLFADDEAIRQALIALFRARQVVKQYLALAFGRPRFAAGMIDTPLDGQPARSRYRVIAASETSSLLEVNIETGRTHQIRRHLAAIRHPLLGDKQYGMQQVQDPRLRAIPRQMLHARQLTCPHPVKRNEKVEAKAPLPADFKQLLQSFELKSDP